jgi:excinuclease ABC subunit B
MQNRAFMETFFKKKFELVSPYQPTGDQPKAIEQLVSQLKKKDAQVLLGVTGSGKTFTMANVISQLQMPTLVLCHNKTLAAQLFQEFRSFFPHNAVEYFVSYYDYYQPEAYIAKTDTYIEKDSAINEEIDKLRHSATRSLLERSDVIIVSSVSCIYGLGSPEAYQGQIIYLEIGRTELSRQDFLRKLVEIQYTRNDVDFTRGTFRVRGDIVEIFPSYEEETILRIEFFDDEIEAITQCDALSHEAIQSLHRITIFPASHYVTTEFFRKNAMETIKEELKARLSYLRNQNRIEEAKRLQQRTLLDLEMIKEIGYCQGIENYSRHFTGREKGSAPPTLLEYFPKEWLLMIDESHVTVPQIRGMANGDQARKKSLVEHGFRLPSALDNRPLFFEEFNHLLHKILYVSATPAEYEITESQGEVVEQVIRPTGLLDPIIEVRSATTQVDNLLSEIHQVIPLGQRVMVTVLTKDLAEKLSSYYSKQGIKAKYLHSDIDTLERVEIIHDFRLGTFDVLIGINLLREGLDIPEVGLIAILDADKEGFLRSETSLIQTIGRAARNIHGRAILYADRITKSMEKAISETQRRRSLQEKYNEKQGITPVTIQKSLDNRLLEDRDVNKKSSEYAKKVLKTGRGSGHGKSLWGEDAQKELQTLREELTQMPPHEKIRYLAGEHFHDSPMIKVCLQESIKKMQQHLDYLAKEMHFEKAARVRDRINELKKLMLI